LTPDPPLFLLSLSVLLILFTIISPSSINRLYRYYDITHMPAQTLVFSEQFTSTCVFRTIGLLECFTLSLGWQWSALSTLFPGLDFLTALSLSLSSHPSESSSLPLPLLGSLSEAHSHSLVTSLSLSLARSLTLTPPPPLSFICFGFSLARSLSLSPKFTLSLRAQALPFSLTLTFRA
jgi:hypothetical protein